MEFVGELAALATALLWSFTAIFFSEAGKRIGSFHVNKIRLVFAVCIYTLVLFASTGELFPTHVNREQWFWLGLSGFIGLVLGDGCGFKSLVMIGPRLATLIMASTPIMTTLIAWFFLDEKLKLLDMIGIAITISGIAWVVLERNSNRSPLDRSHPDAGTLAKGVLLALLASLGQASGLVFSKHGMLNVGPAVQPLEASFVRMIVALIIIWGFSALRGTLGESYRALKNLPAMGFTMGGAAFGPFLGVWMSLVSVSYLAAGISATLSSMAPVLIIPTIVLYYKEKVSPRAVLGACLAVIGVAILFLA